MPVIKPKFDGKHEESARYGGPPLVAGPYHGKVKTMWYHKIKSGDNAGEDQYTVLIEVDQGKFKGAPVFHSVQMLTQSAWSCNQLLDAMCANEKQRETLRTWFWDIGCDVEPEADKVGQKVTYIGKPKFKPVGKEVSFIVKIEPGDPPRPRIDRFVIPIEGSGSEEPTSETPAAEDDSGLEEFEQATSSNPEPEPAVAKEEVAAPPPEGDDDDDPWS